MVHINENYFFVAGTTGKNVRSYQHKEIHRFVFGHPAGQDFLRKETDSHGRYLTVALVQVLNHLPPLVLLPLQHRMQLRQRLVQLVGTYVGLAEG